MDRWEHIDSYSITHSLLVPFSYSITSLRPQRCALPRADLARAASSTVSYSTKAKPLCWPSIFLGSLIFLREPNSLKSSLISFLLAWKARFLTISLLFFIYSFWIFSLRALRSCELCTFFLERLRSNLWPSTSTLFSFFTASTAFSFDSYSTKPKPIDLPSLPFTILAYLMGAIFSKISQRAASSVWKLRFLRQTTLLSSSVSSASRSTFWMRFSSSISVIMPSGAYSRQMKLFLNLWFCRFCMTLAANSAFWNSAMAMARLGAIRSCVSIPQNYSSSLSSVCCVRQLRFFTRRVFVLRSQRLRSFSRKSRFTLAYFVSQSLVSWMTSASASAILGARLSARRISDLVMWSFLAILSRMVLGLRKRVFQLVVSLSFSRISRFFFFLKEERSSMASPYFSFTLCWNSVSLPVLMISPMSSREGLMWMMRPKTTLLSISAKARTASYDFWQVMKKKPLFLPSYSRGSFTLVMAPNREKVLLMSSYERVQGMFVMYRRLESISSGFVTNFLFFSLRRGALMGFTSSSTIFGGFGSDFASGAASLLASLFFFFFGFASSGSSRTGCSGTIKSSQLFLTCCWMIFLQDSKVAEGSFGFPFS